MTTYELPPEPEVGARVRDHHGHVWTHTNDGWSHPELRSSGLSWGAVMAYASPVELIEPDPWPTAPLIVADWQDDTHTGRGLLIADRPSPANIYVAFTGDGYRRIRRGWSGDAITNVIPVAVVPAAEWEALAEKVRGLDAARTDRQWRVVVARAAELLLEATDALGVDQ